MNKNKILPLLTLLSGITTAAEELSDIEVIEVRAQKRVQNIQDVSQSISFINGQALQDRKLKDTTALSAVSPNFKVTQNAAEGTPPALNIRGVGSVDYNTSTTSPVGIYVDNVAGGSANSQIVNLFDVESVEVLRGPQGTLFGRNSTGGALLIHNRAPDQSVNGYLDIGIAERDTVIAEGAYNQPLSENIAARLAFTHQEYDYSVNNLHPGSIPAGLQQTHARFTLAGDWDKLKLTLRANWGAWDGTAQPVGSIGVVESFDPATGLPASFCSPEEAGLIGCTDAFGFNDGSDDFYDIAVNNEINGGSPHISDFRGINLNAEYYFSADNYLVSVTGYDKLDRIHFFNSDASPASIGEGGQNVFTDTFTQELRWHRNFETLYLTSGLFYLRDAITQDNFFDLFRDFRASPALFSNAATFLYDNQIDTEAFALFSQAEIRIDERNTLTVGLRYTDESTDYTAIGNINIALAVNDQQGFTVPGWFAQGEVNDSNISGRLALNHAFSDSFNGFISYDRGFKSGGYNGALIASQAEADNSDYGAETLDAYEIGLRKQWQQVNLAGALFYYDYQDQQVFMNQSAAELGGLPLQLLTNVGESQIYGAELELNAQVTEGLRTQLAIGYLPEANLEEFVDAAGNVIRDNRLPFTSRWNVSGVLEYVYPIGQGELLARVDFDHQSEFFFDQNQNPFAAQDDFTLWNARLAYAWANWTAALWVKNLTNEEYSNLRFDVINLFGTLQDFKGEARQFGGNVQYRF